MPRVKLKKRPRSRRNPTSIATSSGGGGGEVASWEMVTAAGVGYAGTRVIGTIGGGLGQRLRNSRRGGKIVASAATLVAVYVLIKKFPQFRKYKTVLMAGAVIAFLQALLEEFAPRLAGLLGLGQGVSAQNQQRQIAAVQAEQKRIFARRTVVPHSDDAMYDAMEATYASQHNAYQPPQEPQAPPQGQPDAQGGDESGESYGEDEFGGAGGIFAVD